MKKTRIHFTCDVLVAVAVLDVKVRYICEAAPIFLFWAPNGLDELPAEMRFEFPFNLIGKLTMAFLTGQSWRVYSNPVVSTFDVTRFRHKIKILLSKTM